MFMPKLDKDHIFTLWTSFQLPKLCLETFTAEKGYCL